MANPNHPESGTVRGGELYRLSEFCRRIGWKEHSLRQARRLGLRTIAFGREKYVLGDDVLEFFRRLAEEQNPTSTTGTISIDHGDEDQQADG